MTARHVAIVGGGYSGTSQAIELLRRSEARVTLIERSGSVGRGTAYGTPHASHLLNVRAERMSAFADDPGNFARWLESRGGSGEEFAQRRVYGGYLEVLLAAAGAEAGGRLSIVADEAVDVLAGEDGESVQLRCGEQVHADAVILAPGNLAPQPPAGLSPNSLPGDLFIADPWRGDLAADLSPDDKVLLIGTGLTAIDAALMLEDAGFQGTTLALSRRGLVPRVHGEHVTPPDAPEPVPPPNCTKLLRSVREDARELGWRGAVDRLRPLTQPLWISASPAERRRFLRHLRPWWDVHRHRIAPTIWRRIGEMQRQGRLEFAAGRIVSATAEEGGAELRWRRRGEDQDVRTVVRRIVNCTGPSGNIAAAGEPLLDRLLGTGRIRADSCRMGIDVDLACRALDTNGQPAASLFAIGPLTKGTYWEIVAVPDIREQVRDLALRLTL